MSFKTITLIVITYFIILAVLTEIEEHNKLVDDNAQVLHTYKQGDVVYQYINLHGTKCVTVFHNDEIALSCHGD